MNSRSQFDLPDDAVHVWTVPTRGSNTVIAGLQKLLTGDEASRAARFRFEHLREAFVAARGALRCLLGRYLECAPGDVRFTYGPKGKPIAEGGGVHFNLSHSGNLAAIAVTKACPVGIDLEQIRLFSDMQQIAERYFCPEEVAEIRSLPEAERALAFFSCWTRKEAYIKAVGDGLSMPLDSFRVTVNHAGPARMIHAGHDEIAARAWTLEDLRLAPGYSAALAYAGGARPLSFFSITDLRELTSSR